MGWGWRVMGYQMHSSANMVPKGTAPDDAWPHIARIVRVRVRVRVRVLCAALISGSGSGSGSGYLPPYEKVEDEEDEEGDAGVEECGEQGEGLPLDALERLVDDGRAVKVRVGVRVRGWGKGRGEG